MLAYTYYESDNRVRRYAEALVKRGDHVDVIALRQKGQTYRDTINGVNLYRIQRRVINEKNKVAYLIKIVFFLINSFILLSIRHLRKPYDFVHVHSVPDFEVFAALIPKLTGAKIILDIHDIVPEFYASKFNSGKNSLVFKALILIEKISIAFSDHVIIANHIWEKTLISRSVRKEKCTVVLNYPDPSIFYKRDRTKKNDKFIILYPGTLNQHQGVDIAIEALAIIKEQIERVEFHIYGKGTDKKYLEDLVVKRGLEDKVFIKGILSLEEIAEVMANSDLGVVPKRADSFGNEAFSTKTFEFMALGVPVIISDTKIDKFYFNDSLVRFFHSGDKNDLAESVLLMMKDRDLRNRLVANSSKYIEENSWDVKKNIYLGLVDSLH